jgi:predicted metalloprotease with PDZ domain
MKILSRACLMLVALTVAATGARAQAPVRYLVRVADPGSPVYHVEVELPARGDTTYVSLPAWTPGHYKLENYARYVRGFAARAGGRALRWDKADQDTWRIVSAGVTRVTVSFEYPGDTVEVSHSLLHDGFGFFNGTNLFIYPETGLDFPAELRFELPAGWKVATELAETAEPFIYRARDYHELVDNPTFVGRFAMDSVMVDGVWVRLAVYPEEYFVDPARRLALDALQKIAAAAMALFDGPPPPPPFDRYTVFLYLDDEGYPYISGLEHAESQLDIMPAAIFEEPRLGFRPYLYELLAHELYHAWNVKRIRPAELWPYAYDREQPTPLLWVAEGITEYYGNVLLARAVLWSDELFWAAVRDAIESVESQPAHEAVEDASLNAWIEPTFVDQYLYYDQGALLGLLLDIRIRDATANAQSLDDVMRRLYRERYLQGRGFSTQDLLGYVGELMGRDSARAFFSAYVDGREPLPLRETLARAGMTYVQDTIAEPFLGVQVAADRERRMIVRAVVPGSAAAAAGLRNGDELLRVGTVEVSDEDWGEEFQRAYADSLGGPLALVYKRGGARTSATTTVRARTRYEFRLFPAEGADERQVAIRRGIAGGR